MSTLTIIVTLISAIAGFVAQAINTGSLFGIVTVPKTWVPYLTVLGTFLTGVVSSLSTAASITGETILQAVLAGFMALAGVTVGVTVHQHLSTANASNDNADASKKAS